MDFFWPTQYMLNALDQMDDVSIGNPQKTQEA